MRPILKIFTKLLENQEKRWGGVRVEYRERARIALVEKRQTFSAVHDLLRNPENLYLSNAQQKYLQRLSQLIEGRPFYLFSEKGKKTEREMDQEHTEKNLYHLDREILIYSLANFLNSLPRHGEVDIEDEDEVNIPLIDTLENIMRKHDEEKKKSFSDGPKTERGEVQTYFCIGLLDLIEDPYKTLLSKKQKERIIHTISNINFTIPPSGAEAGLDERSLIQTKNERVALKNDLIRYEHANRSMETLILVLAGYINNIVKKDK